MLKRKRKYSPERELTVGPQDTCAWVTSVLNDKEHEYGVLHITGLIQRKGEIALRHLVEIYDFHIIRVSGSWVMFRQLILLWNPKCKRIQFHGANISDYSESLADRIVALNLKVTIMSSNASWLSDLNEWVMKRRHPNSGSRCFLKVLSWFFRSRYGIPMELTDHIFKFAKENINSIKCSKGITRFYHNR